MLHVLATIDVQPGQRAAFLEAFARLMPTVHQEDGCLEYGPATEVACPSLGPRAIDPDRLMVVEKWRDMPALEAHLQAPHLLRFREEFGPLIRSIDIRVYEPLVDALNP